MNAKEYIEQKYNITLDEPFSYYNIQWLTWMEEYANYKLTEPEPIQQSKESLHLTHNIPFYIDPIKALEYGKCNSCGKWFGDCKGH